MFGTEFQVCNKNRFLKTHNFDHVTNYKDDENGLLNRIIIGRLDQVDFSNNANGDGPDKWDALDLVSYPINEVCSLCVAFTQPILL